MSSILKALKKLEQDKHKAVHKGVSAEHPPSHSGSHGRRTLLALLAGLVVGGIVVAFILTSGTQPPAVVDRPEPQPVTQPTAQQEPVRSHGEESQSVIAPAATAHQAKSLVPTVKKAKNDDFLPVVQEPSTPVKPPATAPKSVSTTDVTPKPSAVESLPPKPAVQKTLGEVHMDQVDIPRPGFERAEPIKKPDLPFVVTDIYFEPGNPANMAVVNDLPAMEGTTVDGVLLKKIEADKVIFEVDGQPVEVPLTPVGN